MQLLQRNFWRKKSKNKSRNEPEKDFFYMTLISSTISNTVMQFFKEYGEKCEEKHKSSQVCALRKKTNISLCTYLSAFIPS